MPAATISARGMEGRPPPMRAASTFLTTSVTDRPPSQEREALFARPRDDREPLARPLDDALDRLDAERPLDDARERLDVERLLALAELLRPFEEARLRLLDDERLREPV